MTAFPRAVILAAAIVAAISCSSKPSSQNANDATAGDAAASRVLERLAVDLDTDGTADSIVVVRGDTTKPGAAARIELTMSRAGARVLDDTGRYDPAPDEFNGYGNLVQSHLVYVADFERAGRLMLLFGTKHGCCQQSLTIYRLGNNGPEPYFHADEMWIDRSPVPLPGKVAVLAGRKLSEGVAPPTNEFAAAVTYAPVLVYRFEEKPKLDSAATRTLTREQLGGFAGFEYRTDVLALTRRDGSKALWSSRERRLLP